MPSKTWSIMSTGTPVIASFDEGTDMQRIIEDNKVGIFTKADDSEELKNAIIKLYSSKELCKELGINGRLFVNKFLSREVGVLRYTNCIEEVKKKKRKDSFTPR